MNARTGSGEPMVSSLEGSTVGLFTWIQFITIGLPLPLDIRGVSVDLTAVCARTFSPEHLIQALFLLSLLITVYHCESHAISIRSLIGNATALSDMIIVSKHYMWTV